MSLAHRVRALENWRHETEVQRAVVEAERPYLDGRFGLLEARLQKIESTLARLAWIVVITVLMGVIGLLFAGDRIEGPLGEGVRPMPSATFFVLDNKEIQHVEVFSRDR